MSAKRTSFRITFAVATVILLAIGFLLTSVLSGFPGARLDLTSDKRFTMSKSAVKILDELKVPVQVKLYITPEEKMPTNLRSLQRDITDKLRDYERVSGGKLEYAIYNPQDDEDMQNSLASKGVRPFQVQTVEKDAIGVALVWSAMTIAYKDYPEEVIPQVLPQSLSNLEYELVSRVYRLTQEKKPKVALYAPKQEVDQQLAMMYLQQGMQPPEPQEMYKTVRDMLGQEHYDIADIQLTKDSRIPEDASALVVLNPGKLNDRQVFEINRALSNGMPTLMALQAHEYDYSPSRLGGMDFAAHANTTGLDSMLATFGVILSKDHFFDSSLQVLSIPRTQNFGGFRVQTNEPVRAPMQILVTENQMNQDSPLTNRIGALLYLWGTPLELNDSALSRQNLKATTLMTSSDRSWREPFGEGVMPGSYLVEKGKDFVGSQPLAVLLEGEFPDSFQGRSMPSWPKSTPGDPQQSDQPEGDESKETVPALMPVATKLVLIGDAKMFSDDVIQAGQNGLLLLNAVDALALGEDLISIRAKTLTERVIKPIPDGQKLFFRLFAVFLVPAALAVFGLVRSYVRRKEAALYRQHLAARARS